MRELGETRLACALHMRIILDCQAAEEDIREPIAAPRKDVPTEPPGGGAWQKRKLLDKQKDEKERMREYGSVSIPQEAFIAALRVGEGCGRGIAQSAQVSTPCCRCSRIP